MDLFDTVIRSYIDPKKGFKYTNFYICVSMYMVVYEYLCVRMTPICPKTRNKIFYSSIICVEDKERKQ